MVSEEKAASRHDVAPRYNVVRRVAYRTGEVAHKAGGWLWRRKGDIGCVVIGTCCMLVLVTVVGVVVCAAEKP